MNEINTEIIINAPKKIIWDIITDFSSYPEWNPFIVKIFGKAEPGENILFFVKTEAPPFPIYASILEFEREKKLSWGGPGFDFLKPIISAEHIFLIEEISPSECRFKNYERMGGLLPNITWYLIERSRDSYIAMNKALKLRAERLVVGK